MPIERFQMQGRTMMRVNRLSDGVALFEHTTGSQIDALEHAARTGADLSGADLADVQLPSARLGNLKAHGACLARACLSSAKFSGADFSGAVLEAANLGGATGGGVRFTGANLKSARLVGARLQGADFSGADLSGADLGRANLTGAKLDGAKLAGAGLSGTDLTGASLRGIDWTDVDIAAADWSAVRRQLAGLLSMLLSVEGPALLDAMRKGKIDGSDEKAGILATLAGIRKFDLPIDALTMQSVERMCSGIKKGDAPATNPLSRLLADWIEEWLASPAAEAAHRDLCPACGQVRPKKAAA
jgi:uncharacterized protein YjbI with pentapeptide repeats